MSFCLILVPGELGHVVSVHLESLGQLPHGGGLTLYIYLATPVSADPLDSSYAAVLNTEETKQVNRLGRLGRQGG